MYAILKDKNCTDPQIRKQKYKKARPITPYCKHPMKKLLHYAARAWMFILKQLKGPHFAIPTTKKFKEKMTDFNAHFATAKNARLCTKSWDISGCYTNMPKDKILESMKEILKLVKADPDIDALHEDGTYAEMNSPAIVAKTSKEAINLPKFGKGPAHWGYGDVDTRITLTFKQMLDIVSFSLENAFFILGDKIIQQVHGIPMGDPMSPALCIGSCAYLEMKWFESLPANIQPHVKFTRYLDDIFMIANIGQNGIPESDFLALKKEFTENCYPPCLELEETPHDEYLECKVQTEGNVITTRHWNKNLTHMIATGKQHYYKHQHFGSHTTNHSKRGALIGTWTRMSDNTNTTEGLHMAICEKMFELNELKYPKKYVLKTLKYMHNKTKEEIWSRFATH